MATTKIKVCGITNLVDAEKALEYGADMLGFNFYPPSPRCLTPAKAREILEQLPSDCFNVALFVNATPEKVHETVAQGQLPNGRQTYRGLQFHGEESGEYCRAWNLPVIKAFRLKERGALADMENFPADYYLLDSWSAGYGGSGAQFPWDWLDGIESSRLILSGGLRADNVALAIQRIHPYAVDVCSGVEKHPGIKDHGKLKEFINSAKAA